jgi:hypothetical protein
MNTKLLDDLNQLIRDKHIVYAKDGFKHKAGETVDAKDFAEVIGKYVESLLPEEKECTADPDESPKHYWTCKGYDLCLEVIKEKINE